jgi:hypothetical protein
MNEPAHGDDTLLDDEQHYWLALLRAHVSSCTADDTCPNYRHLIFRCWETGTPEAAIVLAGRSDRHRVRTLVVEEIREDALFCEEMTRV